MCLRIMTHAFDPELKDILQAGYEEMRTRGVKMDTEEPGLHPMVLRCLLTYVKLHFGEPANPERLQRAYETQLGQLMTTSGFTTWEE